VPTCVFTKHCKIIFAKMTVYEPMISAVAGLRVKDIAFWKEELLKEVHNMSEETSNLQVKYQPTLQTETVEIFRTAVLIVNIFN